MLLDSSRFAFLFAARNSTILKVRTSLTCFIMTNTRCIVVPRLPSRERLFAMTRVNWSSKMVGNWSIMVRVFRLLWRNTWMPILIMAVGIPFPHPLPLVAQRVPCSVAITTFIPMMRMLSWNGLIIRRATLVWPRGRAIYMPVIPLPWCAWVAFSIVETIVRQLTWILTKAAQTYEASIYWEIRPLTISFSRPQKKSRTDTIILIMMKLGPTRQATVCRLVEGSWSRPMQKVSPLHSIHKPSKMTKTAKPIFASVLAMKKFTLIWAKGSVCRWWRLLLSTSPANNSPTWCFLVTELP